MKTNTYSSLLATLLVVGLPLTVIAAATEERMAQIKDEFNELWHNAAETTEKRAKLEETLANFDSKVAEAKKDLADASQARKEIRESIADQKRLVEVLHSQLQAVTDSQVFYEHLVESQQSDYVRFIRYLVGRDIAERESGTVVGGDVLRRLIRGSLGDSVEDALARQAAITARNRFFSQLRVLVSESDAAESKLKSVAVDLGKQLIALEKKHASISSAVTEASSFIDDSWRQKKLTQDELAAVVRESSESNARIMAMQASLIEINDQLKQATLKKLSEELAALQSEKKSLEQEKEALQRKDEAMGLLEDAALRAFQQTVTFKNTDKKLYKHVEEKELERNGIQSKVAVLQAAAGSGVIIDQAELLSLLQDLSLTESVLALMKQGVPEEQAETYVVAKRQADEATPLRAELKKQVAALTPRIAELLTAVSKKVGEVASVERSGIDGIPPLFFWPVTGVITAGYLDRDYETVFRVPHRAIDIAVPQSTPVRSIADGIVYAVRDGGATGYSYVLIGHRDGYASLYGHVSTILVKTGDVVTAGQVIARSGGKPGTHGAGHMTTGAHLHLEITKGGAHLDPRSILPAR